MRRHYFRTVSGITLALTIWGFSDNLFWRVEQPSNSDPKFIVHGLSCLAWMIVFFTQASLVGRGNVTLHRRLGVAAFSVAIAVTLSTTWLFVAVWKGWSTMPIYAQANRLLLPTFAACVLLAYVNRRDRERHKRYLLIGTLCMLEPVLSRAFDPLDPILRDYPAAIVDGAWQLFAVVVWTGLFLSLFAYDRLVDGKIHRVSSVGFAWAWCVWIIVALF
jgi:hypothetical protein